MKQQRGQWRNHASHRAHTDWSAYQARGTRLNSANLPPAEPPT
jgi:hypothetical protein